MSHFRHKVRKLKALIYFTLPALGLGYEILHWKHQDIPHRAIFCSALVVLTVLCGMWWNVNRTYRSGRRKHRRHRHDDYR
jgi:hypothetical protein